MTLAEALAAAFFYPAEDDVQWWQTEAMRAALIAIGMDPDVEHHLPQQAADNSNQKQTESRSSQ